MHLTVLGQKSWQAPLNRILSESLADIELLFFGLFFPRSLLETTVSIRRTAYNSESTI